MLFPMDGATGCMATLAAIECEHCLAMFTTIQTM